MNDNLKIYALLTGSGIGTKPLQSFLDGHHDIITCGEFSGIMQIERILF
jgi:hypothetical protein